jgi:hypothetical protein
VNELTLRHDGYLGRRQIGQRCELEEGHKPYHNRGTHVLIYLADKKIVCKYFIQAIEDQKYGWL